MLCFASELLRVKPHVGLLFTHKELTRLTQFKFDAFARRSRLVHEVTDTNCWAQNSSSHGYVFTTFKHQLLTNRMRNGVKTHNCCMNIFYSIPSNRGCDVLVQFPFKESWESLKNKNKPKTPMHKMCSRIKIQQTQKQCSTWTENDKSLVTTPFQQSQYQIKKKKDKKEKKKPPHQPQQRQPESTTCTSRPCSSTDNSLPIPSDEGCQATGTQQPTGHLLTKTVLTEHHIRPRHLCQQLQQHHATTVLGEHVGEVELSTAQGHHITDAATAQACWR